MLILSRRERETVLFPELDITVQVAKCGVGTVRLGIEAPRQIRVVRGELELRATPPEKGRPLPQRSPGAVLGNSRQTHLEQAQLALRLAENQLQQQRTEHAQLAIQQALAELEQLECDLAPSPNRPVLVQEPAYSYQVEPQREAWEAEYRLQTGSDFRSSEVAISMEGS